MCFSVIARPDALFTKHQAVAILSFRSSCYSLLSVNFGPNTILIIPQVFGPYGLIAAAIWVRISGVDFPENMADNLLVYLS